MQEVKLKTHLIITDIHEEYSMKWCGSIKDTVPEMQNGKPVFVLRGKEGPVEVNTTDIKYLEEVAKSMTAPKGRESFTTDSIRIFIKEKDGQEHLVGILTHNHIKKFAPMYDSVGYRIN